MLTESEGSLSIQDNLKILFIFGNLNVVTKYSRKLDGKFILSFQYFCSKYLKFY